MAWVAVASIVLLMLSPGLAGAARPTPTPTPTPFVPGDLTNGDFEGGGATWPFQDGIGEVQVPPGWRAYYLDKPPSYVKVPDFCYDQKTGKRTDDGCFWARPEFRDVNVKSQPNRVHSGARAQKYFTYGRMHEAGLMQHVTGVISGTQYHFAVYMEAWMCIKYEENCKGGYLSDKPTTMHLRVGIDPTGGTNAFSPNVVWSREVDSFDHWTQYSVDAVAQGDAITVFTHSRPEWTDDPRNNNDVYVDDATLTVIATPQPTTPTPDSGKAQVAAVPAPAQPQPQSYVVKPQQGQRPDGSVVHIVQSGDTLFGMALAYGVTVDDIVQLNNIQPGQFLQIGQEVIIKGPTQPAPAAAPKAAVAPPPAPVGGVAAPPPAASAPSGLCVQAFNDQNSDGIYDSDEDLVSDIQFAVIAGTVPVITYTTDGVNEPYCFTGLAPRAYTVRAQLPKNYVATTDEQVGVALASGQTANISFGVRPPGGKNTVKGAVSVESDSVLSRYGGTVLGVGGLGVLIAAGVAGWFLVSRRK
jgi:LysM repeat protein